MDNQARLERLASLLEESLSQAAGSAERTQLRTELVAVYQQLTHTQPLENGTQEAARSPQRPDSANRDDALVGSTETPDPSSEDGPIAAGTEEGLAPGTSPGYYPDPYADGYRRWWDGRSWDDQTRPHGGPRLVRSETGAAVRVVGNKPSEPAEETLHANRFAVAGLIVGVLSIVAYEIGVVPLLAVGLSVAGLFTFDATRHRGAWVAWVGLVLGSTYSLAYLWHYGHI